MHVALSERKHFILVTEINFLHKLQTNIVIRRCRGIYLHITFGGVCSIQQRFISSPFNWKTTLKIKEFYEKNQYIED